MAEIAEAAAPYEMGPGEYEKMEDQFKAVVSKLMMLAADWEQRKYQTERRWLDDLRRYHGYHDAETASKLQRLQQSARSYRADVIVNVTRPKTNAMSARLMDMLFPTDEKCWGILPTPVPELEESAEQAANREREMRRMKAEEMRKQAAAGEEGEPEMGEAFDEEYSTVAKAVNHFKAIKTEAQARARAMESEIDDQLVESRFQSQARDMIDDGCRIGSGIIEAPVTSGRSRSGWSQVEGEKNVFRLKFERNAKAGVRRIDPWSFFPDPDARTIEEAQGAFIRNIETKRSLRALAKIEGVNRGAIRRLIQKGPGFSAPPYLAELRAITGDNRTPITNRYCVWRYVGALDREDLEIMSEYRGDSEMQSIMDEMDDLDEINVVILFCDGEVLSVELHPLDSGEPLFSIFCPEKDEASVWGYGVPHMIRSEQRIINAAWRAMMDNAGVAAGPQVVRSSKAKTEDGTNELRPWQVWVYDDEDPVQRSQQRKPVETLLIDMNQEQLAAIIMLAREHIDEVTSIPRL